MSLVSSITAFWDLDADSLDDSGNGHDGVDTSVTYDGLKATFASPASVVTLTPIVTGTTWSFSAWAVLPVGAVAGAFIHSILMDDATLSSNNGVWTVSSRVRCNSNGVDKSSNLSSVADSVLANIVVVCTAGALAFFANNVAKGTATGGGEMTLNFIGNDNVNGDGTGNVFGGTLQSLGLWSRALTAAEITLLYNGGVPRKWTDMNSNIRGCGLRMGLGLGL